MSNILDALNEKQREAAKAIFGPVLILAGAGSGKTRTLTHRIAYLLEENIAHPSEILALTFTNKAAKEMRQRVGGLVSGHRVPQWVGTFHSLGARILREHAPWQGRSQTFGILDAKDSEKLAREALTKLNVSTKQWSPRSVRNYISNQKNQFVRATEAEGRAVGIADQTMARAYVEYERLLSRHDAFDFDDLLLQPIALLQERGDVARAYQSRWRFLSVDEYQDTNSVQERLLTLLLHAEKNICAVGDDYQAIYSWRGAKVDHILHFEARYPKSTIIYLTQNYRSTPQILGAANALIKGNQNQKHKELWTENKAGKPLSLYEMPDERSEARYVRQHIEAHVTAGGRLLDCVVLYRTNAQSRVFEEEFLTHRVPYSIVGGFRFYERKEVKDGLALLTLFCNPRATLAVRRLADSFLTGIGPKTVARWEEVAEATQSSIVEVMGRVPKGQVQKLSATFAAAKQQSFDSIADTLRFLLTESGYLAATKVLPDGEDRMRNLEELLSVATTYTDSTKFLEDVALLSDLDTLPEAADRVLCMTLHAAKGLEFPLVFLTGLEDGLLPHRNSLDKADSLEEERRLLYVGMTRAKQQLHMTYVQHRTMAGETLWQRPSRFLEEIPPELMDHLSYSHDTPLDEPRESFLAIGGQEYVQEEPAGETFASQQLVYHPAFGTGVVVQQSATVVTCIFEGHGIQTVPTSSLSQQRV